MLPYTEAINMQIVMTTIVMRGIIFEVQKHSKKGSFILCIHQKVAVSRRVFVTAIFRVFKKAAARRTLQQRSSV